MAKIIIEGTPGQLAIIKKRFRSLGVKISDYTERVSRYEVDAVVSEAHPPSGQSQRRRRKQHSEGNEE